MTFGTKLRFALLSSCALVGIVAANTAQAGGFAVREQSTEFQGMSFAGDAAAGGALSGMFWNPAVAASAPKGYSSESDYTGIFGNVTEDAQPGSSLYPFTAAGLATSSGNIAPATLVPASYSAYRLNSSTVLALSINSPFGLTTKTTVPWVGQLQERTSDIKTYDFVPTVAVQVAPGISVGAGIQIEKMTAHLTSALSPSLTAPNAAVDGDDTAFGFTAGVNFMPSTATSIGLGYRSAVSHKLSGTLTATSAPSLSDTVTAKTTLPEIVTLSARQSVTPNLRLDGTVEWTHWSDLQKLDVSCTTAGLPFCAAPGAVPLSLPFNWHDSWMFALGGEYDVSKALTVRSGLAYELSPVQNPNERTPRLPDQNRLWLSGGASYMLNNSFSFDFAYSHFWGLGGDINYTTATTGTLIANVSSSVDIVSASLKFKMNP